MRKVGGGGAKGKGVFGRRHSLAAPILSSCITTAPAPLTATTAAAAGSSGQSVGGIRERLGSNRVLERPRPRTGSKVSEKVRFESGGGREVHADTPEMKSLLEPEEEAKEEGDNKKLALGSTLAEVAELMKDPVRGVCLLQRQPCLPALTFVAGDATAWVCDRVEGASTEMAAVELLQKMQKGELLCHASGERRHPFLHGFFLYFLVTGNKEQDQVTLDPISFHNEWHEVEVEPLPPPPRQLPSTPPPCPTFLQADLPPPTPRRGRFKLYRTGHLDLDCNNRSDRIEWGHIKHHSVFHPHQAHELIIQWLCATGTIVTDLMVTWQRKAQACGLHLFPVPSDPLALPYSLNSDPLRGPILVPLTVSCLTLPGTELFAQFPADSWGRRMHLFQFVHVTGNIFVMIHSPDSCPSPYSPETTARPRTFSSTQLSQADFLYGVSSPHVEYFHRLIADLYSHEISEHQPGFLWTFNYMLTRRWKVPQISGDEVMAEKMLHDFRLFCANDRNRLRDFWDSHLPLLSPSSPTDDLIAEP
ncbi:GATOR complex protein DEPDC5 [Chionoecetes opilio]|uniref:GATOR complex protein DEPDC5 n=1 Tax=Chionoecetes opilio TaxID=41210 RepID=A0A8J5D153_CHIOP|nr:GATOR complex protein DEPDC5 [Chionoecetes opilio]